MPALSPWQGLKPSNRHRNEQRERGRDGNLDAGFGRDTEARQKDSEQRHEKEAGLDCEQR
jgi:hypothetical protein